MYCCDFAQNLFVSISLVLPLFWCFMDIFGVSTCHCDSTCVWLGWVWFGCFTKKGEERRNKQSPKYEMNIWGLEKHQYVWGLLFYRFFLFNNNLWATKVLCSTKKKIHFSLIGRKRAKIDWIHFEKGTKSQKMPNNKKKSFWKRKKNSIFRQNRMYWAESVLNWQTRPRSVLPVSSTLMFFIWAEHFFFSQTQKQNNWWFSQTQQKQHKDFFFCFRFLFCFESTRITKRNAFISDKQKVEMTCFGSETLMKFDIVTIAVLLFLSFRVSAFFADHWCQTQQKLAGRSHPKILSFTKISAGFVHNELKMEHKAPNHDIQHQLHIDVNFFSFLCFLGTNRKQFRCLTWKIRIFSDRMWSFFKLWSPMLFRIRPTWFRVFIPKSCLFAISTDCFWTCAHMHLCLICCFYSRLGTCSIWCHCQSCCNSTINFTVWFGIYQRVFNCMNWLCEKEMQ